MQARVIQGPYKAKTIELTRNVDGSVQSRTLIHDWSSGNGRVIAIVDDMGRGEALTFDYNPNADAADIVYNFKVWLTDAYPTERVDGWAEELAFNYLIAQEANVDA